MTIKSVICDIDGVLMHDNTAVPGAKEFLQRILQKEMPLVVLTNYPSQTAQDLANRFANAFVIVGETRSFNWEMMHKAAFFVASGARFIATNPDTHARGFVPACGALCAGIEKISGRRPFYVGKPSPYIMRAALNKMQAHSEETVIVGDNLRTDILAGFQAGLETVLVLSGVSTLSDIDAMPFRPDWIYPSVADIDLF
ncbi:MAG: HAD-IIA family hydrolase [Pantoea sp.]|nr:HAD-IIA family hydrolase [Pantoea sp.]